LGEPRASIFERVQHIFAGKRERIVFDEYRLVTPAAFTSEHQGTRVFRGDVLLTVVGAIGRTAVVDDDQPFVLQRSVAVVGGQKGIVPHFLSKAFLNPPFQQWLNDDAKGTAQKGIYLKALGSAQIAVPPLAEQRRIVAKIDSLSTKSRRARDQLDHIPRLVEKYKQAILAAAFRGELTREWRNSNVVQINWITSTIGDVATIASGQTPKDIEAITFLGWRGAVVQGVKHERSRKLGRLHARCSRRRKCRRTHGLLRPCYGAQRAPKLCCQKSSSL
jgi:restriction endonuclease S subunit